MSESVAAIEDSAVHKGKALIVALWIAQLAVAGILGMAAFGKFFMFTPDGSMVLAEALGVGRGVVTLIGVVELAAAVLVLVPKWRLAGGALAALTMLGALLSHATKIGWSANAAAEMWPMALVVLAASVFTVALHRRRS